MIMKTQYESLAPKRNSMFMPMAVVTLWMLTLVSSISVIFSSFQSRQAMQELEDLRRAASGLQVESGQYLLERSALSSYSRIERIAQKDLNMKLPSADNTVLVYQE